jgi:hypothetical protein
VLGMSLDNVKVMLHRARNTFKDHYAVRILAEDPRQKCEVLGALLDTFVDEQALTAEEDALVRQHIKQCETCQQRKREIAAIAILLRGVRLPAPSKSLRQNVSKKETRGLHIPTFAAVCALGVSLGWCAVTFGGIDDSGEHTGSDSGGRGGGGELVSEPTATEEPLVSPARFDPTEEAGDDDQISAAEAACINDEGYRTTWPTCICPGVIDNVIECNNGRMIDNVTSETCAPTSACNASSGTGGSDPGSASKFDPCKGSCGNGVCDATCGEDINSCPADCP